MSELLINEAINNVEQAEVSWKEARERVAIAEKDEALLYQRLKTARDKLSKLLKEINYT